ncbi:MAG: hypothetical protein KGJ13_12890, partial [Patescibacteria group bacterium]|nr:hypothetical protein [Patescibacteria group bacterium]
MADNNGAQVGVAQTQPATPAANPQDGTPQPVPVDATEVIKVNGKEVRLTKAQLVAMAQKGYFADSKLKSIDVLQKSAQALIAGLKTPEGVARILKDPSLGADFKAILKQMVSENADDEDIRDFLSQVVYEKVVKQSKKTPEQIEQEKKLSDYERL